MPSRNFRAIAFLSFLLFVLLGSAVALAESRPLKTEHPRYPSTKQYRRLQVEGWPVLARKELMDDHPELWQATLREMTVQLQRIPRTVPSETVEKLRRITIWVERYEPNHRCMCYHPARRWLLEHDVNPEKTNCVEIANAANFLSWTKSQPWMILHELAHGYHDQFLPDGFHNRPIIREYRRALAEGDYGTVLTVTGRRRQAYAAKDQMEFFAETTEAYFGTNDFYPFVRGELLKYDPRTAELLKEIWRVKP